MPLVVNMLDKRGKRAGTMDVSETVLGVQARPAVLRQALDAYMANQRHGSHSTKNRARVVGSSRKPWRQKGTGNARAGTRKSPIWRGGGVVFGPTPRGYRQRLNKKMRRQALLGALSDFHREEMLFAVEDLIIDQPSTRSMIDFVDKLGVQGSALLLIDPGQPDEQGGWPDNTMNIFLSARNLNGGKKKKDTRQVTVTHPGNLNIYDLLTHNSLVVTRGALERLQEVYG